MPLLLSLETATDVCAAALVNGDGELLGERSTVEPRRHSEQLLTLVSELLEETGESAGHIDAVAVSAGPGSYTGLRIGVSTAKGITEAGGCSLIAVPSLEAMAWETLRHAAFPRRDSPGRGTPGHFACAFRSRKDEAYAALFLAGGADGPVQVGTVEAGTPADIVAAWDTEAVPLLVSGAGALLFDGIFPDSTERRDDIRPSASAVGILGARMFARGLTVDPLRFEPYYLKDFVVRKASRSVFDRLPF